MEENINIAEILRNKPHGVKLYSPIFGECTFCYVREDTNDICVKKHNGVIEYFNSEGYYFALGVVRLFPSKEMTVWCSVFHKGAVLVCYEGRKPYYTIFDCFESNTYKGFNGKFAYDSYEDKWYHNEGNLSTNTFYKLSIADSEIYITKIEERFGGKMNHETLDIENTHPEFKDGDVLFVKCYGIDFIEIFNCSKNNGDLYDHASLETTTHQLDISGKYKIFKENIIEIRLATEEEKQQLFLALEKEGKRWDSDKKSIVDLKTKVELKPFDKVVVRCSEADRWSIDFFSHKVHNGYICTGDAWFGYCLPYNDETAHLLGTTDEWKGGEG